MYNLTSHFQEAHGGKTISVRMHSKEGRMIALDKNRRQCKSCGAFEGETESEKIRRDGDSDRPEHHNAIYHIERTPKGLLCQFCNQILNKE